MTRWLLNKDETGITGFALSTLAGMQRDIWKPALTEEQRLFVKRMADAKTPTVGRLDSQVVALLIGFHSRDVWSDEEDLNRGREFGSMAIELAEPAYV